MSAFGLRLSPAVVTRAVLTWPGKLPGAVSTAHPSSTLVLTLTHVFLSAFLSCRSILPWLIPVIFKRREKLPLGG